RSQSELEEVVREHTEMTRFGVAKHLRLLEEANLVVTRKQGRTKLHHLNAVPIRAIHDRWIGKYTAARTSALLDLKRVLEDDES
ncbi:ArsR/SmtB family transcription factor, partial [Janibacter sp. RAF20_2_2]